MGNWVAKGIELGGHNVTGLGTLTLERGGEQPALSREGLTLTWSCPGISRVCHMGIHSVAPPQHVFLEGKQKASSQSKWGSSEVGSLQAS